VGMIFEALNQDTTAQRLCPGSLSAGRDTEVRV
jgi:hypothetical protein